MSGAFILAAVTALLKNFLENSLIQQAVTMGLGDVTVSALPPDRVPIGTEERLQMNLYLYRLTPNSGWRRADLSEGKKQEQFLVLDLHYLLTAYSERDLQAEVLLGAAIQSFQQASQLSRADIIAGLRALSAAKPEESTLKVFASAFESEAVEHIRITPEFLSLEDLSKLWSSLQARARLSLTYQVSVASKIRQSVEATGAKPVQSTR